MLGLLYGIAEKLNDEFQRYAQFSNNSKSLFYLALSKLIPVLLAATLSYAAILDIRFVFPVLLLVGSILIGWPTYYSAMRYFIKIVGKSFFAVIKMSFNYIRQDILQITCVFMGMSLLSFDKWLLQYFSATDLPTYMLFAQIASIFIVTQTIVLIAPVRARLVNENPQEIRVIKIGSPIISLMSLLLGIAIYYQYNSADGFEHIGFFAFFLSAIVTFSVAYTERLYWVTTAGVRLALDATIVAAFVFSVLVLQMFWPSSYLIVLSLGILFCLMCIRVLVMMYLISKISPFNN
jgi:uncharacterized membrane protein